MHKEHGLNCPRVSLKTLGFVTTNTPGDVPTSCKNDLVLVATKQLQMSAGLLKNAWFCRHLHRLEMARHSERYFRSGSQQRWLEVVPTYRISCGVTQQMLKRRAPSLDRIQTFLLYQLYCRSHNAWFCLKRPLVVALTVLEDHVLLFEAVCRCRFDSATKLARWGRNQLNSQWCVRPKAFNSKLLISLQMARERVQSSWMFLLVRHIL